MIDGEIKSTENFSFSLLVKHLSTDFLFSILAPHDALFIVGALDEALLLRGLRYHPIDLEMSVARGHKGIGEW